VGETLLIDALRSTAQWVFVASLGLLVIALILGHMPDHVSRRVSVPIIAVSSLALLLGVVTYVAPNLVAIPFEPFLARE